MPACLTPFIVKQKTSCDLPVPCGKCPVCATRRASAWSFRLVEEEKRATSSQFITLTYDTTNVHISRNGFMSLKKTHLQKFFSELRNLHREKQLDENTGRYKWVYKTTIKYFAVGEYGGKTKRPHYHVILFNADITKVQLAWPNGNVHYGDVCGASVGYTLKYISKPQWRPMHINDDREPQFSLMSKGLGSNYLTPAMVKWHKADLDNRMYINLPDNKKAAMPRYYKDKIYNEQERKRVAFHSRIQTLQRQQEQRDKDPNWQHNEEQARIAAFNKQKFKNTQTHDKI